MKTLIIQTSPPHTGSTFLVNALHGLFTILHDKPIVYREPINNIENIFKGDIFIVKTHDMNIDKIIEKYGDLYTVYFVCSERKNKEIIINNKYKTYENVIIFDFDELNETSSHPLTEIVDNIYNKIYPKITGFELDKEKCCQRIIDMNNRYELIKEKPFSYVDDFYEIHGHHRNRK
jgi:hypothetical protein